MSVLNAFKLVGQALAALEITEGVIEMTDAGEPRHEEPQTEEAERKTFVEEFEVEASQLVERIKELIREGNARTLRVKDGKGRYVLELPLTVGVVAGGVFALAAPTAAILSTIAGFVAKVKIEVVRDVEPEDDESGDQSGAIQIGGDEDES